MAGTYTKPDFDVWLRAVKKQLVLDRPDVDIAMLDIGACNAAYHAGLTPVEFTRGQVPLRPPSPVPAYAQPGGHWFGRRIISGWLLLTVAVIALVPLVYGYHWWRGERLASDYLERQRIEMLSNGLGPGYWQLFGPLAEKQARRIAQKERNNGIENAIGVFAGGVLLIILAAGVLRLRRGSAIRW